MNLAIVSQSIVIGGTGPAPNARRIVSAILRRGDGYARREGAWDVPNVDGAITKRQHLLRRPLDGRRDRCSSRQDRCHQGEHLAARTGATNPVDQAHRLVDQRLQPETDHQRRRHDQPGVGDQRRIIEAGLDTVDRVRY